MNFPILSIQELSSNALELINNNPISEREFKFSMLERNLVNVDVGNLIYLLSSTSEEDMERGVKLFHRCFFALFGSMQHTDFFRISTTQKMAIFAKKTLGDQVVLFDEGYTTLTDMENGTLFVWCDEIMFIYERNTYTITGQPHYARFYFYEDEPAYVVGKVSQKLINKTVF